MPSQGICATPWSMRPADEQTTTSRRFTVQEAAEALGVTVEAIRGRIKRGTLTSTKGEDGAVFVQLPNGDQLTGQTHDQPRPADDQTELVEALRDQIEYLRQQLEEANRANAEHRRLLAAAFERIPDLEPAQEPRAEEPSERRSWWRRFFGFE